LYGANIASAVGGAWIAEHIGTDHAAINRIDELVESIGIGDHANERTGWVGCGAAGKTKIGVKRRISVRVEGVCTATIR
jgi:hypothetical protein